MTAALVLAGVLGLAVGSFLNVLIYRLPRHESLMFPASHCPACETPIRPRHNVPIASWLLLRGRCAACAEPISLRYPLVEAITAALFVAITARFGLTLVLPAYLYLAAIAVALAMIDFDAQRLPDAIVLPSYVVAIVLLVPAALTHADWSAAARSLVSMALLWLGFFALRLIHPKGMGYGDVKLAGLLGLFLGWVSWSSVIIGALCGFVLASVVAGTLLATRRATRKTAMPFGPYMLAGALLALFVAAPISTWYGSLLSPHLS
jgi:leader peptidase (prepilin peptidase) / N-methyltransferase